MDSAIHRKLMLLNYCLPFLANNSNEHTKGVISSSTDNKPLWICQFNDGTELVIVEKKVLSDYVAGRTPRSSKNKEGKKPPISQIEDALCIIFPKMSKISKKPLTESKKLPVYEFGHHLGLSKDQCRYIIDKEYASYFPMLRALSYKKADAKKFCESNSGCYYLYRHDLNSVTKNRGYSNGVLVRAAISIRYPVPHKPYAHEKNNHCNVRVKLNIPSYLHERIPFYQYDGLVGKAGKHWWAWMFQGRFGDENSDLEDLMMMYTEAQHSSNNDVLRGQMLTQNQDTVNAPAASNIVLIPGPKFSLKEEKQKDQTYWSVSPGEDEFMQEEPKVIDISETSKWTETDKVALAMLLSTNNMEVFTPPKK